MLIRILLWLWAATMPLLVGAKPVVLTSFPESFYSQVEDEFKQRHPDSTLQFMNKKTPALIAHLMQQREPKPDLVWLSSSDAMALMEQLGYITDPIPFAWSHFGFFWHNSALRARSLPQPVGWESLLSPQLVGQLALSAPSRSGTNHLVIELILQQYGWKKGWQVIAQLSGNLATITARSFGVRQGIIKQRFSIAPVVDFFYKNALELGHDVGFSPIPSTPLIPAQIAHVKGSHSEEGQAFISFLLSDFGQQLISSPQLNRISLQQGQRLQQERDNYLFDEQLSASRYHLVNRLFDLFITERLGGWKQFWMLWHRLEQAQLSTQQRLVLMDIKSRVVEVPIDESVATDPTLNAQLSPIHRYEHFSQRMTQTWQRQFGEQLSSALLDLEQLSQQVER